MPITITPRIVIGAGDLRYSVGFYQRGSLSNSPPDYGNTQDDFPATASFIVPANITPKLGGEDVLAARLTGQGSSQHNGAPINKYRNGDYRLEGKG